MQYQISRVNLEEDRKDILEFWGLNSPAWPTEKFSWFYESNPYGSAACWILREAETNRVVGSTAVFPRKMFVKGQYVLAGITGDFAVQKNYRILGPALQLQRASLYGCQENQFDFLYGYPNGSSQPVQCRAGFKIIGSAKRMVKYFKSNGYIGRHINMAILPSLLSRPTDLIMRATAKETHYKKRGIFNFELRSVFDHRFDALWQEVSSHHTIIGERTTRFLTWRFAKCPYRKYKIFAMTKHDTGELLGYIIYYVTQGVVRIADLLVLDMARYTDELLSEFLLLQRELEMDAVSIIFFGNDFVINKLKEYNFSVRNDVRNIVAYAQTTSPFTRYLRDENSWYLTEGDND